MCKCSILSGFTVSSSLRCSICILVIRACRLWSCLRSWPLLPLDSFASLLSSRRDTIKLLSISHLFCRDISKILSLLYLLSCDVRWRFSIYSHFFFSFMCNCKTLLFIFGQIVLIWYLHFWRTYFSKHWTNPKTLRIYLVVQDSSLTHSLIKWVTFDFSIFRALWLQWLQWLQ